MLRSILMLLFAFATVCVQSEASTEKNYSYASQRQSETIGTKIESLNFIPALKEWKIEEVAMQQLADIAACVLMESDPQFAAQAREAFGEKPLPITGDPSSDYLAGSAIARTLGIEMTPEQYFIQQGLPVPKTKGRKNLYPYIAKHFRETVNENYKQVHAVEWAKDAARKALEKRRAEELVEKEEDDEAHREIFRIRCLWIAGIASGIIMLCFCKKCTSWRMPKWAAALVVSLLLVSIYAGAEGDNWYHWQNYDLPYGFFIFLRLCVSAICFWFSAMAADQKQHPLLYLTPIAFFMLYQPFIMVELERTTWFWINLMTIPALMYLAHRLENGEYSD